MTAFCCQEYVCFVFVVIIWRDKKCIFFALKGISIPNFPRINNNFAYEIYGFTKEIVEKSTYTPTCKKTWRISSMKWKQRYVFPQKNFSNSALSAWGMLTEYGWMDVRGSYHRINFYFLHTFNIFGQRTLSPILSSSLTHLVSQKADIVMPCRQAVFTFFTLCLYFTLYYLPVQHNYGSW